MKKFDALLILSCLAVAQTAASASAQAVPVGCREARPARAYQQALSTGQNLASLAWSKLHDCARLGQFVDKVAAALTSYRPASKDLQLVCRYTGFVDGVFQAVSGAFGSCSDQCCMEGQAIGEMSAQLYCDLSILLDGLGSPDDFVRGPVDSCGSAFQACCDSAFTNESRNYRGVNSARKQIACRPYTVDAYRQVWSDTRELECAYEVDPLDALN